MAALLAAFGGWLAVDAVRHGGLMRYRLFGIGLGALCCAPLLLRPWWRRRWLRRSVFAMVPTLALLVVLELLLRATGFGAGMVPEVVPSPALGHALLPGHGEADANGLRNRSVPERAAVLFVGDSLTYGFGAAIDDAMPQRLAALRGCTVYNAGLGGYGPIQYRQLVRRFLALQPRDVVVAFYFGNDLHDAFRFAWLDGATDLRRPDVVYPPRQPLAPPGRAPNLALRLLDGAIDHSRLLGILALVAKDRLRSAGSFYDDEPGAPHLDAGAVSTYFAPGYCLPDNALASPELLEGLRLSKLCLGDIGADCERAGARAWLLLLHTKECAYQRWLAGRGAGLPALAAIPGVEAAVHGELAEAANAAGMRVLDPTAALIAALDAGEPMWPHGSDPHPAPAGYDRIAREVAAALDAADR